MQNRGERLTRMALKYIHTTAASVWLGSGLAVLVLLRHDRLTGNGDELFALNHAITSIDDLLIEPAAAGTFASGAILCLLGKWGVFRHRWIAAKLALTLAAIVFGILCLGPWLKQLSLICATERLAVFDDWGYARTYRHAAISGILQTALLFALALISICKPSFAIRKNTTSGGASARTLYNACKHALMQRLC